jgi:hypothetical protein
MSWPAEVLDPYCQGPDRLEAAVEGLPESDLDLTRAPGEWSIRQIVHHLVDGELHWLTPVKMALVESGRIYAHNLMDEDRWADALDYAGRPTGPSLDLFRALRAHVAQLLRCLPDSRERCVSFGDDAEWKPSVAELIAAMNRHSEEHIEEILEIRRRHGV